MQIGPGVILDIITLAIVVASAVFGARKGLTITLVSFISWFCSIFAGLFFFTTVRDYLCDKTSLDDHINTSILKGLGDSVTDSGVYKSVPDLFSTWIHNSTDDIIYATAASITHIIMSVISLLLIILVIKLVCALLILLFSRKNRGGLVGWFDGLLGFIFGTTRGVIIVLVFFAFLVPLFGLVFPDFSAKIVDSMDTSYVARYLYHDNTILLLLRDFFS